MRSFFLLLLISLSETLFSAPLLGPALGPIIGGALTQGFSWRATFWFLVIFTGTCLLAFLLFKDTYRRERSLIYQRVARRVRKRALAHSRRASQTSTLNEHADANADKIKEKNLQWDQEYATDKPERPHDERVQQKDVEAQQPSEVHPIPPMDEIRVTLRDVNPIQPMIVVLRRLNNATTLFASGALAFLDILMVLILIILR